ncbi:MAG: Imidazole glycerol phosphate synthase subunit HisF [Methanobacterium sp. PtaU1.Bin242]|nr:MAG: Imidazole glycerol phosphate synthase subunit HisF [Methanobacterium sp. PtaU1.Bin242]
MEIIPVLDLMSGMAVSGKSGQRDTYEPLKTVYSSSPDPVEIAISLKRQGAKHIYIADLDAIEGAGSNLELVRKINHLLPVILDWGVKDFQSFKFALDFAEKIIVATETLKSLEEMDKIIRTFSKKRIVISLDIKDGQVLSKIPSLTLDKLKSKLMELKPEEIILLDISGVGTEKGFNKTLLDEFRGWESLILGGGITPEELETLKKRGINKFLMGTALHSGQLPYPFDF